MISATTPTHVTSISLETAVAHTLLEPSVTSYSGNKSLSVFDTNTKSSKYSKSQEENYESATFRKEVPSVSESNDFSINTVNEFRRTNIEGSISSHTTDTESTTVHSAPVSENTIILSATESEKTTTILSPTESENATTIPSPTEAENTTTILLQLKLRTLQPFLLLLKLRTLQPFLLLMKLRTLQPSLLLLKLRILQPFLLLLKLRAQPFLLLLKLRTLQPFLLL